MMKNITNQARGDQDVKSSAKDRTTTAQDLIDLTSPLKAEPSGPDQDMSQHQSPPQPPDDSQEQAITDKKDLQHEHISSPSYIPNNEPTIKSELAQQAEDFNEKQAILADESVSYQSTDLQPETEPQSEEIQNIMKQFKAMSTETGRESRSIPSLAIVPPGATKAHGPSPHSASTFRHGFDPDCKASGENTITPTNTHDDEANATNPVVVGEPTSPNSRTNSIFKPPPPEDDEDSSLPFDFHRFLEQLRHRTADPVARFLRSFLNEFSKKQWLVHEQVKIISDFLEFIAKKMAQCEVWRLVSEAEFDNAREGMEKLVMNRLYGQTFSPMIPPSTPISQPKQRRTKPNAIVMPENGRRGQHQEDVERDDVIAQKIKIYGWIREEHLDIPSVGDKGRRFLALAQQELLKINAYRAPRDKIIQVLNCCKVLFGFLKNNKTDQSADSFVPLLIYTVIKANPAHLVSNVQYILRFRNQDKLGGEAGYYLSSLSGVVSFVETLDRTNLTISNEEFEKHVEAAVSLITEGHEAEDYELKASMPKSATPHGLLSTSISTHALRATSPSRSPLVPGMSEKSAPAPAEVTPRNSYEGERISPRRSKTPRLIDSIATSNSSLSPSNSDNSSESGNIASGFFRTIQRPISTLGRIFSDSDRRTVSGKQLPPPVQPVYDDKSPLVDPLPDHPTLQPTNQQSTFEDAGMLRLFAGGRAASYRKHSPATPTMSRAVSPSPLPRSSATSPDVLSSSEEPRYGEPPSKFARDETEDDVEDDQGNFTSDGQRTAVRTAQKASIRDAETLRVREEEHILIVE